MINTPIRDKDHNYDLPSSTIRPDGPGSGVAFTGRDSDSSSGGDSGNGELTYRRLKLRDLRFLVSSLRQEHLDQPDSLLNSAGPLAAGLRALRPLSRNRPVTSLAFMGDQFAGYVQFDERGPDRRWIATNVGLAGGLSDDRRVLDGLLEYSVKRAGSRAVKRLFARIESMSVMHEAFLACGFEPYMDESIHLLSRTGKLAADGLKVREQESADTWAVHQLYHAAVPKHVQYAEAWTSHRWDVAAKKGGNRVWRAYVMEDGYQLIAYAGVKCASGTAVIEAMYLPDRASCLAPFVRTVLGRIAESAGSARIYATARGYQQELKSVLEDEAFQHLGDQQLLIKYTTAKVATRAANATVSLPADVRERVPKQIPTYLKRPAREEKPV